MPPFLHSLVDRLGGRNRALIALVGAGAVALILVLSRWASAPTWVPAFGGVPIEQVGPLTEKLDAAGIKYRLERGGADVMVDAADLARARVAVAREGGLPNAGRPGLELFDQPSWGMTDFTQRINYRRALEGELERTIGAMRGIEAAQVHLALHEGASFREADKPVQASVVLKLRNGQQPTADVVQGIAHLVASSVDGVESENVTVVDDAGRLLSDGDDPASPAGLSSQQLKLQRQVEAYLERKADDLVSQIVGRENARVQVAAAINFDKVERTVQTVDPDKQATATEQTGGKETARSYENSRSLETFSGAIGNVTRLSVAVLVNDRRVPAADSGAPAVRAPRAPEELARIEALVRSAVGADSARGDVVSVASIPFDAGDEAPAAPAAAPTVGELVQTYYRPAVAVLGLALAFGVALLALRSLRAAPPAAALPPAPRAPEATKPTVVGSATRQRAALSVESNPEIAARLVRSWMRES